VLPDAAAVQAQVTLLQKTQDVGRKQDRHEEQVDMVVIRSAQRLDTKAYGASVLGLIRCFGMGILDLAVGKWVYDQAVATGQDLRLADFFCETVR
jgi:hypothetical protein